MSWFGWCICESFDILLHSKRKIRIIKSKRRQNDYRFMIERTIIQNMFYLLSCIIKRLILERHLSLLFASGKTWRTNRWDCELLYWLFHILVWWKRNWLGWINRWSIDRFRVGLERLGPSLGKTRCKKKQSEHHCYCKKFHDLGHFCVVIENV